MKKLKGFKKGDKVRIISYRRARWWQHKLGDTGIRGLVCGMSKKSFDRKTGGIFIIKIVGPMPSFPFDALYLAGDGYIWPSYAVVPVRDKT